MFDLDPSQRLSLLNGLCELLLGTFTLEDHLEQKQNSATELWKKRVAGQRERNDQRKEEKLKREGMKKLGIKSDPKPESKEQFKKGIILVFFLKNCSYYIFIYMF